jgi:hypothetical protein
MSTPMHDMPEHYPIDVDKDGNGPAEGDEIDHRECWCGKAGCMKYLEHRPTKLARVRTPAERRRHRNKLARASRKRNRGK